jgi:hypothetical protein
MAGTLIWTERALDDIQWFSVRGFLAAATFVQLESSPTRENDCALYLPPTDLPRAATVQMRG